MSVLWVQIAEARELDDCRLLFFRTLADGGEPHHEWIARVKRNARKYITTAYGSWRFKRDQNMVLNVEHENSY